MDSRFLIGPIFAVGGVVLCCLAMQRQLPAWLVPLWLRGRCGGEAGPEEIQIAKALIAVGGVAAVVWGVGLVLSAV
jgi:hypothetical protein